MIAASNNTVAPYWPGLYAGFLKGRIESLIFSVGSGGGGGGGAAPAAGDG